jgi:hypothetical protein
MTIPANRKRFPIVFITGLMISVLLILLIVDSIKLYNGDGYNNSLLIGIYIGLSFWIINLTIFSLLDYTKTTFNKNAALTITDNGITDNLSIFSVGNISWTEITDIKIMTAFKTDFLVVGVANPQLLINRKSKLKQLTLKSFLKRFGSPIVISQKRVDYNLSDLKEVLLLKGKPK